MGLFDGKKRKLLLGLLFDGLGMVSLLIPGIGPALDLVWHENRLRHQLPAKLTYRTA